MHPNALLQACAELVRLKMQRATTLELGGQGRREEHRVAQVGQQVCGADRLGRALDPHRPRRRAWQPRPGSYGLSRA